MDTVSDSDAFELHPVSGEIDYGDLEDVRYRRLDEETLQAKVVIPDFRIIIIYLWCDSDEENPINGWRVLELKPVDGEHDDYDRGWYRNVSDADRKAKEAMDDGLGLDDDHSVMSDTNIADTGATEAQNDGDEDYWALYDKTPGRTPAVEPTGTTTSGGRHTTSTSDADYFARYAQVQPEMDNDDPSEDRRAFGETTLNGNVLPSSIREATATNESIAHETVALPNGSRVEDANGGINQTIVPMPRPRSSTVSKLEESAETQSIAESAIMHHVSTSVKSLYRLCRSSGIQRSEFDRMIHTELDTLSMIEEDD